MRVFLSAERRLQRLNHAEPARPWQTLLERRRCIACQRTFRGKDVRMKWTRPGLVRLMCPTRECESQSALWVRLGNPLIDALMWSEWDAAITAAERI